MPKTTPFDAHHGRYEVWFDKNKEAYISELLALRYFLPLEGKGIEIGVGSGRFAAPFGISTGIDPSSAMLSYAIERGIRVAMGTAEDLPLRSDVFDYALVVTTICFVDSPSRMMNEIHRVLKPGGRIVVGFVDRESDLGQNYLIHQGASVFYKEAVFYSTEEVEQYLVRAGFSITGSVQTLSHSLEETIEIEPIRPGSGQSAFVVIAAQKTDQV